MTTKRMLFIALLLLIVGCAVAAYLVFGQQPAAAGLLTPDDEQIVLRGEEIYRMHCAACHGAALEGQANWRKRGPDGRMPAPPHDHSGHTWHHPDAQLFRLTKLGPASLVRGNYESNMPGYADVLNDADIVAVLSYIKSTWPAQIRRQHDLINERARQAK